MLLLAYFFGMLTMHKHFFPTQELLALKNKFVRNDSLLANTKLIRLVTRPKPRNEFFELFAPASEIVMIGDSLTEGGPWSEIFPQVKIANRGIGGDRAIDILQRMNPILAVKPKKAFLLVGLNDFASGMGVHQTFNNYIKIVEILQVNNIKVYIQSTAECSKAACGNQLDQVRSLNLMLKQYAIKNHLKFINVNSVIASKEAGLLPKFTTDGSHLSAKGYLAWSNIIKPYILESQDSAPTTPE